MLMFAQEESHAQAQYAEWLSALTNGAELFVLSELVLHGFVRAVTNPRIFDPASTSQG